jgi:hypothetical protein
MPPFASSAGIITHTIMTPETGLFACNPVVQETGKLLKSDIAKHKFMRWSVPRHLGMLGRYRRIPTEVSDRAILEQHPRVKMWERILPFLIDCNSHYKSQIDILA